MSVRIVIEHTPSLFAIIGLMDTPEECPPTLTGDTSLNGRLFYRAKSTERWVLYRASVAGHGEQTFHPEQR